MCNGNIDVTMSTKLHIYFKYTGFYDLKALFLAIFTKITPCHSHWAPEGGKRITAHHCRVAKGVNGIIILLPILGECWLRTIPKALHWADLFLAFLSPLCFESEQA